MKFATHTKMVVARFADLMIANHQGSTTGFTMVGQGTFGKFPNPGFAGIGQYFHRWWKNEDSSNSYKKRDERSPLYTLNAVFLGIAFLYLVLSCGWFYGTSVLVNKALEEPLMEQDSTDYYDATNMMDRQHEVGSNEELPPPPGEVKITAMRFA